MSLKGVTDNELANDPSLLGLADDVQEGIGRISKMPKEQQSKLFKNLAKQKRAGGGAHSSRSEAMAKLDQLPKSILDGLGNKRLQLADTRFYTVKEVSAKSMIDVYQGIDSKNVGLGNLAQQKIEKDNWFLLFGVIMVYGENAGGKETCDFGAIPPIIRNGEFELEAGNKKIVGLIDCSGFDTRNRNDIELGYWPIANTKWIEPQTEIKMPVKFAAIANANAWLKVILVGTSIIPY